MTEFLLGAAAAAAGYGCWRAYRAYGTPTGLVRRATGWVKKLLKR